MPYKNKEDRIKRQRERFQAKIAAMTEEERAHFYKSEYQRTKEWYKEPEVKAERNAMRNKRRAENPELRAKERAIAAENRERSPEYARELRRLYGITREHVEEMKLAQGNKCAICNQVLIKACVDHCHETGMVRALLCDGCNKGLGSMRDDAERVRKAAEYLERFKPAIDTGLADVPFPEPVKLLYQHNTLRVPIKNANCQNCSTSLAEKAADAVYCGRSCKEQARSKRRVQ